ncbi:hypothetical protein LCGC14_1930450 [marine sediment metagenome]|uniref:Uncharacterized protein n=1 Tax=marine sediment metagenome TaxID=412755 RepID=A0A0F9I226_9ZZZZ
MSWKTDWKLIKLNWVLIALILILFIEDDWQRSLVIASTVYIVTTLWRRQ